MDLPFHLKTLPPEALDVLRYFGSQRDAIAHALTISDGVGHPPTGDQGIHPDGRGADVPSDG
jgi:hypothetical protein